MKSNKRKIAFITTLKHNVGDDFIREGLIYLFDTIFNNHAIYFYINKHKPFSVYKGSGFFSKNRFLYSFYYHFLRWIPNKILSSDLTIISGAPVYWYLPSQTICSQNEWFKPLIKNILVKRDKRLFNIAAGTCQEFYSDGSEFLESREVCEYIKELYNISSLTTVRDNLSKRLLSLLDLNTTIIPCPSIFLQNKYKEIVSEDKYIVLNYMSGGGHYNFNNNIDIKKWEKTFKQFYERIKKNHNNIVFSCHNQKEVKLARNFDKDAKVFFSKNFKDYIKFYSKAKFGIVNRVHAAFAIASFGKPSIIVGNDSRARMAGIINLKSFFVNDVDVDLLMDEFYRLNNFNEYEKQINEIKKKAFNKYKELIMENIS